MYLAVCAPRIFMDCKIYLNCNRFEFCVAELYFTGAWGRWLNGSLNPVIYFFKDLALVDSCCKA